MKYTLEEYLARYIKCNAELRDNITAEFIKKAIKEYEEKYGVFVNVE